MWSPEFFMRSRAQIRSHAMHPMLVALTIELGVRSLVCYIVAVTRVDASFAAAGFYAIIGGCIGAALAAVPGAIDLFTVVPPRSSAKTRGYLHGGLNVLALAVFIAVAAIRGGPAAMPTNSSVL